MRTWSRRWLANVPREAFAANGFTADQIFVNVQALSGAPANNAVYQALVNLGDTDHGTQPAAWRSPLTRIVGQPLGEVVQGRALHRG